MKNRNLIFPLALSLFGAISLCLTACGSKPIPVETSESTVTEQYIETTDVTESVTSDTTSSEAAPDGYFATPDYTVSVINGVYYLKFTEENGEGDESGANGDNAIIADQSFLAFSSIDQMKQAFREGLLTEKQLKTIQTKFTVTDWGYELCNFEEMLCPKAPEGVVVDAVYLYGLNYNFNVRGAGELTAGVYLGDAGKYERQYDSFMEIISNHQLDSHTTETRDGVAYETYVITTNVAQIKYVFMTIPAEGKATPTRVIMRFLLQSQTQPDEVSDTVPRAVYIYGEENGMPYDYLIHGVSEAPTIEWLSSFGLAPYEDDPSAAVS